MTARLVRESGPDNTEALLRQQVAVCSRLLNMEGILGYSGHVSARLPDGRGFLIQPFDQSRAELSADDLLVCDADGRKIAGPEDRKAPSEVFIHSEILGRRADVNAVAHFHYETATLFTLVEGVSLLPVKNHAIRWASGFPVHSDPSHVNSPELGRALAEALGPHNACLIRAHGQVVVAEDVPALFIDSVHFVENAEAHYRAAQLGKVIPLDAGEIARFAEAQNRPRHVRKLWRYYVGKGIAAGVLGPEAEDLV